MVSEFFKYQNIKLKIKGFFDKNIQQERNILTTNIIQSFFLIKKALPQMVRLLNHIIERFIQALRAQQNFYCIVPWLLNSSPCWRNLHRDISFA